ncbi:MAG TPA: ZIP family metal transporter [Phycisphaerae bacterium]|jgi:zinc and cadmium transporter
MRYALLVALLSLGGAAIPLWIRPSHARLQIYLSIAAGALLGAALFHLLPESAEQMGRHFGVPAAIGVLVIFLMQRYVAPHSHESHAAIHVHGEHEHAQHEHEPQQESAANSPERVPLAGGGADRPAGPLLRGLIAILALSVHSFFDGLAIGAASASNADGHTALTASVALSVLIHKPLDGLSVSVLLMNAGARTKTLWTIQLLYAALVPLAAGAFIATEGAVRPSLESPLIGMTLAFSAGTFLAIALTDLLPELQFHTHDRNKLTTALLAGLLIMLVTSLFGHGEQTPEIHEHATPAASPIDHELHRKP